MTTSPPEPTDPQRPDALSSEPPSSVPPTAPVPPLPGYARPSDRTSTPSAPPAAPMPPAAAFFDAIRRLGVVRPDGHRWIAGVASGLARRWGVSPGLVRIGFVLFGIFTGVGLAVYGLLWLLLPHPGGRIHAQEVLMGKVTAGFVGALLAILADGPFDGWHGWDSGPGWHHQPSLFPIVLLIAVVWFIAHRRRSSAVGSR